MNVEVPVSDASDAVVFDGVEVRTASEVSTAAEPRFAADTEGTRDLLVRLVVELRSPPVLAHPMQCTVVVSTFVALVPGSDAAESMADETMLDSA